MRSTKKRVDGIDSWGQLAFRGRRETVEREKRTETPAPVKIKIFFDFRMSETASSIV